MSEPETPDTDDQEPESDRSMDRQILGMQRAIRIIKTLGPAERAYIIERCKEPNS